MPELAVQHEALWNAPIGLALFDLRLRFLRVNEAVAAMDGIPAAAHAGKTVLEVLPEVGPALDERLRRTRDEGGAPDLEMTVTLPGAATPRRHWRVSCFTSRAGDAVAGLGAVFVDITERTLAVDALREREQRMRLLIEHTPASVAMLDRDMRYLAVSRRYLADLRVAATDVVGRSHYEVLPEVPERWKAIHRRCLAGAVERAEEDPFPRADGTIDWTRWEIHPWRTPDGEIGGIILFAELVTEQRQARESLRALNERLLEADRRKDEFLAMLSHELRNPLGPIRNSLYLLDHVEPTGQEARWAREVANRQVLQLTRLVDDLLDVTRIARGKIRLHREAVDVAALVRRTADDHRATMDERSLTLRVEAPDAPVWIWGDETRLAQVFGNLLGNAAKFTPAGGCITVTAGVSGGRASVGIHDTGAGIDPALLPTIFDPLVQGQQTLARSEGGLGLGLSLVKGLVALHGGEVHAVSEGTGRGATFTVVLPLSTDAEVVAPPRAAAARPERRRKVLVVDDNRDAAESLSQVVALLGHTADAAYDGPSALRLAKANRYDVVLCDLGLPGMDGYAVARELRATHEAMRLVAVSGYAQPDDVARAVAAGFDDHLAKPVAPERVADAIVRPIAFTPSASSRIAQARP